jgi:hypothetical protein
VLDGGTQNAIVSLSSMLFGSWFGSYMPCAIEPR